MKYFHLLPLVIILITWTSVTCFPSSNITGDFRLPTTVIPLHYDLHLKTYLSGYAWEADEKSETFQGLIRIFVEVKEPTDRIVLHSESLIIHNQWIRTFRQPNVEIIKRESKPELQFVVFHLNKILEPQETADITIEFEGKLRRDDQGFFLTTSPGGPGQPDTFVAATQFETTFARSMVPCFDEPEFKATWQVTLTYPNGAIGLTNTAEKEAPLVFSNWTTSFHKITPKMSSYLLAVFIGDVKYCETTTDRGTRIRVYVPPAYIDEVWHALNVSRMALEGFEKLFNVNYPMEKLDIVGVLRFSGGAMENWGLLIHTGLYIIGEQSPVPETVIHEVAHQWFGNLVTLKFWNNLWLNEGLTSYMEGRGLQFLTPGFDRDFYQTDGDQNSAFMEDNGFALNDMDRHYNGDIDIPQINYSKGSSFARMLENIIGTENFENALRWYLAYHSYQNTDDQDFYNALEAFAPSDLLGPNGEPFDISAFAECWTYQNGYPTIYVEEVETKRNTVRLTQRSDKKLNSREKGLCGYRWDVPIWYQQSGRENVQFAWLGRDQQSLELEVELPVVINVNSNGYYKVIYSSRLFNAIADQMREGSRKFSNSTKFRLLSDSKLISDGDLEKFHGVAKISNVLSKDKNLRIVSLALLAAEKAKRMFGNATVRTEKDQSLLLNETTLIVDDCDSARESIDECYSRISLGRNGVKDVCSNEAKRQGQSKDRLLDYLKTEHGTGSRGLLISLIKCSDKNIFKKVLADEQYHLTSEERLRIEILSQKSIGEAVEETENWTKNQHFKTLRKHNFY